MGESFLNVEITSSLGDIERQLQYLSLPEEVILSRIQERVAETVSRGSQEQIASEGVRGGGKYDPLKESTVRRKGSSVLLIDTSQLLTDITSAQFFVEVKAQTLEVTLDNPYAGFLQTGTRNMVARPPVQLTEKDMEDIELDVLHAIFDDE